MGIASCHDGLRNCAGKRAKRHYVTKRQNKKVSFSVAVRRALNN
jgi:hypothetical protein